MSSTDHNSGANPVPMDAEAMKEEESILKSKLVVFGTDVGSIPCFRNSFLYGISGGIGAGIVHFAVSSRIQKATRFGFWSYMGITLVYWCQCRYDYTMTKFQYQQLQFAMKENARREGTSQAMPKQLDEA